MKRILTYLLCLFIFISSCNKNIEDETNTDPRGYADSQVVGSWKITAIVSDVYWDWDNNGTTEKNIYNTWTPCMKDNLYSFEGDKTGTYKLNCSVTHPGAWYIANAAFLVYTPISLSPESEKITFMTNSVFKTVLALTLSNGQDANITKTWTRQ